MKIKYMGKLDPETNPLPTNKLKEGAIRFNEPTDRKKQNIQTSIVTFIIICIMFVPEYLNVLFRDVDSMDLSNLFSYFILANILLVLSKLCQFYFYKEIYMFKIPRVGFAGGRPYHRSDSHNGVQRHSGRHRRAPRWDHRFPGP